MKSHFDKVVNERKQFCSLIRGVLHKSTIKKSRITSLT